MTATLNAVTTARMDPRVYVLSLVTFSAGVASYVHAGLLAPLVDDLGVSLGRGGLIATVYGLTFAVTAPMFARVTARLERKRLLLIALGAMVVAGAACAFAPSFEALLAARVTGGLAAAVVMPLASGMAAALVPPERRGRALAVVVLGMTVAFTLGIPLGSVVGDVLGWRATFGFAAAIAALALVASAVALRSAQPVDAPLPGATALLKDGAILGPLSTTLLSFVAIFAVIAFVGPVVTAITGREGAAIGLFQSCIGVGSLVGVALGGRWIGGIMEKLTRPVAFAVMVATQTGFSVLLLADPRPALWVDAAAAGLIFVSAAALFGLMPMVQSRLVAAAGSAGTLALALNGSTNFLGQALGAGLASVVIDQADLAYTGLAGAVVALVALAVAPRTLARR